MGFRKPGLLLRSVYAGISEQQGSLDYRRGNGEVCGALAGALAVIGLRYSRARADERENPQMWADTREMVRRFREEIVNRNGTMDCRDIAGVNWLDRGEVKAFYTGDKVRACIRIVGRTALVLGEMLERK